MHDKRNYYFDLFRGMSALLVFLGHLRAAMFVDFAFVDSAGVVSQVFYLLTGFGHQAVMVFFVLSGFLVGGSLIGRRDSMQMKGYAVSRLSRLWIVLIPSLIFTCLIDFAISASHPEVIQGLFFDRLNSGPNADYSASWTTFLGNICFVQTLLTPVYGSNAPYWSLANEAWYYILFPLSLISVGVVKRRLGVQITCGLLLIVVTLFTWSLMEGFVIWSLGALAYYISSRLVGLSSRVLFCAAFAAFLLFSICVLDSKVGILHTRLPLSSDLLVGLSFALLCCFVPQMNASFKMLPWLRRISLMFSEHSYTLYLFHFPIVIAVFSVFYADKERSLAWGSFFEFSGWALVIYAICALVWWVFERNTAVLRSWMTRCVTRAPQPNEHTKGND